MEANTRHAKVAPRVEDPASDAGAARPGDLNSAFEFVQSLAAELSQGRIDLPSPPEVTRRLHQALDADDLSDTIVTRVISSDATLTASVLALAGGRPSSGRSGRAATDLKLAVTRVGPDKVRSAALPYVLEKLRSAQAHEHIRDDLERLWEHGMRVAAIARVLASWTGAAPPDVALLAGLLHNVGSVYLLSRTDRHAALLRNPAVRDVLMRDWQASIGKAIAHNWGLPEEIADAIGDQDETERHDAGARDLSDVLCVAVRAAAFFGHPDELEIALGSLPRFQRLGLSQAELRDAMHEAADEIEVLRSALGH